MSTDQNKSVVRRFFEDVWGKGQTTLLGQVLAADVCDHNPGPGQPRGLEGQRWFLEQVRRAVPDMQITLEHLVAEGDRVADHWVSWGTQTGEFFGIPPTGKRFCISGTDMFRVTNGKIAEMWHMEDNLSMMQELGVIPAPPQSGGQTGSPMGTQARSQSSGGRTPSADEMRSFIRRGYQELIDQANAAAADSLVTSNYEGHYSGFPPVHGREEFKRFIAMYNSAISNNHAELEDIIVEGAFAACRVTFTGRHTGELMGVAPTGKQTRVTGLSIFRFEGDRVAEQWVNNDDLGMLQQLGVVPAMAGAEVAAPC